MYWDQAYLSAIYGRIFIPMRAVGMIFDMEYRWDKEAQEIILYSVGFLDSN